MEIKPSPETVSGGLCASKRSASFNGAMRCQTEWLLAGGTGVTPVKSGVAPDFFSKRAAA
jgi:hypothetical protein